MPGFFYNLGRSVRAGVQKSKWIVQSLAGSDDEAIAAERQAGIEIARAFEQEAPVVDDAATVELLTSEVAPRLVACIKNKRRKFDFKAVALPEPNAFALPGGFIYITQPLIELCGEAAPGSALMHAPDAERAGATGETADTGSGADGHASAGRADELAFILAHEIGHVVRGHAMQRLMNSTVVSAASRALPVGGAVGRALVQAGSRFLSSAYSQDHELEADAFGLRLARAAGFDPLAGITMMRRLKRLGGDHPEDSLGSYFASHPPFNVRIRSLRELV